MNRKNLGFLVRAVCFCLVFCVTFVPVSRVFARKSLVPPWDMTNKVGGFFNEPEEAFDVMFFGSSHAYASFLPDVFEQETGLDSYVLATQLQPMWATYAYIRQALKTQSPALIVVECNMMGGDREYYDDGVNFSFADDLPLSADKLELARAAAPPGERFPLLCNFMKYHGRWSELTREDFLTRRRDLRDPLRGFVSLPAHAFTPAFIAPKIGPDGVPESGRLLEKNLAYLERIIALCEQEGTALWLVKAPSNTALEPVQAVRMERLRAYLDGRGLTFDDFNQSYEQIGLDVNQDFYDQRHLNAPAAARFTAYFADLLAQRYPDLMQKQISEKGE